VTTAVTPPKSDPALLAAMPEELREAAASAPHLLRYLATINVEEEGFPVYFDVLTRAAAGSVDTKNIL
jgi:hypothetical protein